MAYENLFQHLPLGQVFSRTTAIFVGRFDVFLTLLPATIFGV